MPASRVSTRSSRMLSQDQRDADEIITPVNKIRGLVKTLTPRKRQAAKREESPSPTSEPLKSPQMTLLKAVKRKRTSANSMTSPKMTKNDEDSIDSKLSLAPNLSPLFPVLKLRRTAGSANSYVALLSEKNGNLNGQNDVKSNENSETSQDKTTHKHNTRFKGKKRSNQTEESEIPSRSNEQNEEYFSLPNGESLIEVYTKRPSTPPSINTIEENSRGKHFNGNKAYANRGVQPRNHNQEMRVGDVVWGKVHGHPWWPGRILGILCHASESEAGFVKVAWYGSTTTSEISCSFLVTFQENFKQLFKKQKHGAYRRAVREAQQDLQVMSVDGQVQPV
ncbi:PWWP domain-containing protein 2A-like isoform X2 [Dendronephthya gigantea]|nr:PWWP domain-containing protein 2A-like isoform X2 [Dendronephthya gigantea]